MILSSGNIHFRKKGGDDYLWDFYPTFEEIPLLLARPIVIIGPGNDNPPKYDIWNKKEKKRRKKNPLLIGKLPKKDVGLCKTYKGLHPTLGAYWKVADANAVYKWFPAYPPPPHPGN